MKIFYNTPITAIVVHIDPRRPTGAELLCKHLDKFGSSFTPVGDLRDPVEHIFFTAHFTSSGVEAHKIDVPRFFGMETGVGYTTRGRFFAGGTHF